MSSVTRLTIALAVIMVEISDDVHMLLPVLVAIMVAKWVADAATHSLYHALLEVKCTPFLVSCCATFDIWVAQLSLVQ
jgi:chloride channel 7